MAKSLNLLILLASLTVWQSAAYDACDSVECLPGPGPICAMNKETNSKALFADDCVLRCTNCRMGTGFKKVNSSLCSADTKRVTVCVDSALNYGNKEAKTGDPDEGIAVVQIDVGQEGRYDEVPPFFGEPLPVPLPVMSMGSELLRQLVMSSQPEPPRSPPEGLTLITADVKVDVTINMQAPPQPPPPAAARLGPSPPLALPPPLMLAPLLAAPPPPQEFLQPPQSSAAPQTAAALATLLAVIVAALNV